MAKWTIQREEAVTFCEDSHPVRLGRNPEHYQGEPWERRVAINTGKRGYLCPGGMDHTYPVWVVFDAADDRKPNVDCFDVYSEARACLDRLKAGV